MNRHYTPSEFLITLENIRHNILNPAITTDVIVGFPGETEQEFFESLEFVKKAKFAYVHIFPYSVRKGTKAASMENQVDKATKDQRARLMKKASQQLQIEFLKNQIGKSIPVLFEECIGDNCYEGFTPNYQRVVVQNSFGYNKAGKRCFYKRN
jgi:threonylcarbamoyladenosine tRNA methylthiotransferase MtaB